MRQRLIVSPDSTGIPTATIPFTCMWDIVEYLSYQRVAASYQYEASHFTVAFPSLDLTAAQQLLDGWSRAEFAELQYA